MLVSISEAARMVRRGRATLYRDIDRGRLHKAVSPNGESVLDTAELIRVYGQLFLHGTNNDAHGAPLISSPVNLDTHGTSNFHDVPKDDSLFRIMEERIHSLERIIALEAELRKVKDQVTDEMRSRLDDKDQLIKMLESKVHELEHGARQEHGDDTSKEPRGFWAKYARGR
ncbi:hypothetical protein GCM10027277_44190 [Pseudoduganella ginsengisoli]|uniref:Entry exclusion protein 1 n=1 Tax=Pseudoduganella ginsengisoli TaxID=1462440 RepID=A0A6L6Q3B8_9BURK|nr:hypothetical protein [Pseudoduganella ginsengisoli]MTW03781.1 hypothetical protein [Pseudoduganella ginsengisoli]